MREAVSLQKMKALAIEERPAIGQLGQCLQLLELPLPQPKRHEVRIRIHAAAIAIDDQHMAEGTMFGGFPLAPKPTKKKPWVPGTGLAGTIDALGKGVSNFQIGQAVYGMRLPQTAGPWAEFGVTKARYVSPIPAGWSETEAASLCLGGTVVCSILAALGEPRGKHCLIVGASGGIGCLLVQVLAKAGARVWGVCSGQNRALVESLGAERVINYQDASFGDQLQALGVHVDAVIDLVGGRDTESQGRTATKSGGRFITIVGPVKHVGQHHLGVRGITAMLGHIVGIWLRSRLVGPRYHFVGPLGPDFSAIRRWIIAPAIRPVIDREFPFNEAAVHDAIQHVASHRARGSVVIRLSEQRDN